MGDMVYQGAVWGPPLWNTYFSDACIAIRGAGFEEVVFADDLNAFRPILPCVSDSEWGRADRVIFDSRKGSFHILSRSAPVGDTFTILGISCDPKLLMHSAVGSCVA
eukprot:1334739-Pyramimonas_sp.AAC.1